jgi:glycosyltransferase involved in cell wall biosynthesis
MRVAIDVQTTLGQPTGFGFYVSNLTVGLKKLTKEIDLVAIKPSSNNDFSTPQRLIWDQFTFPGMARKERVDIIHQPCFSAPIFHKGPVVVTIHDIISILFPKNIPFASRMFYSKWMPLSYKKALQIITISHSTKKDIVKVLKIREDKITVIPLAVDPKFSSRVSAERVEAVKKKYNLPKKYILHIGTLEPRKNLDFLIEVFSEVIKDENFGDFNLVITGKKGWYYEGLFEKVRQLDLEKRVIFTGYFEEGDKPALYRGAALFAFPSLYEGFGLPPLEAMASGVPVVSSDTSSMPEVVGEAGILIPPQDKSLWVRNIKKVLSQETLQDKMKAYNKLQVAKFSWDKTAKATVGVYRKALDTYEKK